MSKTSKRRKRQEQQRLLHRESSRLLQKSAANPSAKKSSNTHRAVRAVRVSWKFLNLLIVFVGLISSLFSFYCLTPKIDLQSGQSLDPKSPFQTRFILQNKSILPIHNVSYQTVWTEGRPQPNIRNYFFKNAIFCGVCCNLYATLKCDETISLRPLAQQIPNTPPPIPYSKSAIMLVTVNYEYPILLKWKNRRQTFQFYTLAGSDGTYQWFPMQCDVPDMFWKSDNIPKLDIGDGNEPPQQPLHIIDTMPYVEMSDVIVKNNFTNDSENPIEISYSLKNKGGMPAKFPHVDWKIWDLRHGPPYGCWENICLTNSAISPFFISDEIRQITDSWQDVPHGLALYNEVIAGNFDLVATLNFEDIHNHTFGLIYQIVPTNGVFFASYRNYTGYFTNLIPAAQK